GFESRLPLHVRSVWGRPCGAGRFVPVPERPPMSPTTSDLERLRIRREAEAPRSPFAANAPERPAAGKNRRGLAVGAVLAVLVAGGAAYGLSHRAPMVHTAPVEVRGGIVGAAGEAPITSNGYVVARTKASVAAKIAGRLAYLGVSEGSHVKKDEVMARIE